MKNGVWIKLEIERDEEMKEMTSETRTAYLDIMTTITDIILTGYNTKQGN